MKLILGTLVLLALLLPFPALTHDIYAGWKMPDVRTDGQRTNSCCNSIDCKPRKTRFVNDHWEVYFDEQNRWLKVPDQKVETRYDDEWNPGDKQGHACISSSGNVYCMRPGEDLY